MSKKERREFKFTAKIKQLEGQVWFFAFLVPKEVSDYFLAEKQTRLICTLNEVHCYHCALMPQGEGRYFINTNKEIRAKLGLQVGSSVEVKCHADHSRYGMEMPPEFEELLWQDPEGDSLFHALTAGKQRTLIHLVGKLKSSEKRIQKALVILDFLKETKGEKLDFKALNEAFKAANEQQKFRF